MVQIYIFFKTLFLQLFRINFYIFDLNLHCMVFCIAYYFIIFIVQQADWMIVAPAIAYAIILYRVY